MSSEPILYRGWTASDIRESLDRSSEAVGEVIAEIAANPGTTSEEIAERLGLSSHLNVRALLSAYARVTNTMGVVDESGKLSWPFRFDKPAGARFWRYWMPEEEAKVVLGHLGLRQQIRRQSSRPQSEVTRAAN